jgi:hypothetical protein
MSPQKRKSDGKLRSNFPSLFLPPVRGVRDGPRVPDRREGVSRGGGLLVPSRRPPLFRSVIGGALDFGRAVLGLSIHLAFGETLEDR